MNDQSAKPIARKERLFLKKELSGVYFYARSDQSAHERGLVYCNIKIDITPLLFILNFTTKSVSLGYTIQ